MWLLQTTGKGSRSRHRARMVTSDPCMCALMELANWPHPEVIVCTQLCNNSTCADDWSTKSLPGLGSSGGSCATSDQPRSSEPPAQSKSPDQAALQSSSLPGNVVDEPCGHERKLPGPNCLDARKLSSMVLPLERKRRLDLSMDRRLVFQEPCESGRCKPWVSPNFQRTDSLWFISRPRRGQGPKG